MKSVKNIDLEGVTMIKSMTPGVSGGRICILLTYPSRPPGYSRFQMEGMFNISRQMWAPPDWVAVYLAVMAGHWLPSTRYDYNDLGGAGA